MFRVLFFSIGAFFLTFNLQAQIKFSEIIQTDLVATHFNDLDFSDVDGDGDLDFVMAGFEGGGHFGCNLYLNNGKGIFQRVTNTNFPAVGNPSITFVDIDGDDDEDLFIAGLDVADKGHLKLYTNDGFGNFTELPINLPLSQPLFGYDAAFSDIDKDGDQDLCLIGGQFLAVTHAQLYLNDGAGHFTEATSNNLEAVVKGTVDFNDIDNDGDPDLLITGLSDYFFPSTKLYENDGTGKFEVLNSSALQQVGRSAVAFSDIDGDGDDDLILSGRIEEAPITPPISAIYSNNGLGEFTELTNNNINQVIFSAANFGDIEGDGDNDLLLSGGASWTADEQTSLYLNDGSGQFSETLSGTFDSIRFGKVALEDLNGDQKLDIIFSGLTSTLTSSSIAKIYANGNVSSIKPPPSNSIIKSYSFSNNGMLDIELTQVYKDLEIKVYNILGQITNSANFKDTNYLQMELEPSIGIKLIAIKNNNQEIGIIKLIK